MPEIAIDEAAGDSGGEILDDDQEGEDDEHDQENPQGHEHESEEEEEQEEEISEEDLLQVISQCLGMARADRLVSLSREGNVRSERFLFV